MLKFKFPLRWISRIVIGYMLVAFGWWALHLWKESRRLFETEKALLESKYAERGVNLTRLYQTVEYQKIEQRWQSQQRMILAEGVFFSLCLVFGLWMINRAANQEVALVRQHRNFLLSITHELKSPLASIRLILETLCKRDLQRPQTETLCLNGLRDTARLQTLVEDLLLAARLEDQWHPLPEPVDFNHIVQECVASLQTRFPKAAIRVSIPNQLGPVVADKSGLQAVVQNLLENAVKYAPEGSQVDVSVEKNNGKFRLRIADQGIGIPNDQKEAIFQKFYRIGNEDLRQSTGTGLGLYIVKQVVQAHGGTIQVTDNRPKGTIFTVEI